VFLAPWVIGANITDNTSRDTLPARPGAVLGARVNRPLAEVETPEFLCTLSEAAVAALGRRAVRKRRGSIRRLRGASRRCAG